MTFSVVYYLASAGLFMYLLNFDILTICLILLPDFCCRLYILPSYTYYYSFFLDLYYTVIVELFHQYCAICVSHVEIKSLTINPVRSSSPLRNFSLMKSIENLHLYFILLSNFVCSINLTSINMAAFRCQ